PSTRNQFPRRISGINARGSCRRVPAQAWRARRAAITTSRLGAARSPTRSASHRAERRSGRGVRKAVPVLEAVRIGAGGLSVRPPVAVICAFCVRIPDQSMDPSIPAFVRAHYAIEQWRHAIAIMKSDFSDEWQDVLAVLCGFRLQRSHISVGGGRKSQVADALDRAFADRGWGERSFATRIVVDDYSMDSPTHKVDCFENGVGLEIEWNNKDPFFDRDLNNFPLLFELRALHVGIIVTRC